MRFAIEILQFSIRGWTKDKNFITTLFVLEFLRNMNKTNLIKMLSVAGKRMSADLKEQLISHPAELGKDREEIIRQFLRSYLPNRFEVSTGFVFDSQGEMSKQLDIIIADANICPKFETVGGIRLYPCECVVAVGQVKSSLTSITKLNEALDNLQSVKKLDRSANGQSFDTKFGEHIDNETNHLHQIFTFLFIIGKSLSENTVREEMMKRVEIHEPHLWNNVVLSLEKYLITFYCNFGVCPNPMDARAIAVQADSNEQNTLLHFHQLLGAAIQVIRTGSMSYWEYLNDLKNWDVDTWYTISTKPYLREVREIKEILEKDRFS